MFGNNSFGNTSFGSSTFGTGFGATPTLGAFGSTPQTTTQPQGPIGTTIRFVPLNGTDTIQKTGGAGGSSQITTRHQNISAMKEYETKSTEELRLEDYAANRKVGQPQTAFSSTPFSSLPSTSQQGTLFGGLSLFNTPSQANTTPFGVNTLSTSNKTNLFSAPTTSTTSIFGTNNTNTGFLGTNQTTTQNQQQPFGTNTSIFGSNTRNTNAFGTNNLFNTQQKTGFELNNTPNTGGIFNTLNKPATTIASASPFQLGTSFNTNTSTAGGLSLFNTSSQTNTTPFGANNLTTQNDSNLFNINTPNNATMFANNNTGGLSLFNTSSQANTTPFGVNTLSTSNKTNLFSAPTTSTTSIFGTNNTNTGFLGTNQTTTQNQQQPFGTNTSIFGSNTSNTNAFGTSNLFNTQQKTGFELNNTPNTGGIFNTLNKPATTIASASPFQLGTSFNTNTSTAGGLSLFNTSSQTNTTPFGANNLTTQNDSNLFNINTPNNATMFANNNTSTNQQQLRLDLLLNRLKTLPYGEASILPNDTVATSTGLGSLKFTTDPKTINQYKMKAKTNVQLNKPSSSEKTISNSVLFDGLDNNTNDDMRCAIDIFVPKKNIKKLDLTPSSHLSEGDADRANDSPVFERSRSNIASKSMQNVTVDGTSSASIRRVRYADNTFPGSDTTNSFPSNLQNESDMSSFHNNSLNRSGGSHQSFLNTSNRSFTNSRSGFINTRPDYKTKPTFEEIERRYNSESDTCIIDSLLIDRPNYGSILFESSLDVKGINLDEIVHIRRKEVVVYPDDESKPPVGHGLNRAAVVTLHQVWPIDKSNSELIRDIDRLNLMRYPEKIESLTIEKGARFIEYKPESGSWIFAVKHFSKYGITDDDEELVPSGISHVTVPPQQQQRQQQQQPMPLQQQNQHHQITPQLQSASQNIGLVSSRFKTSTPSSESPTFHNNLKISTRQVNNQSPAIMKQSTPENKPVNQFKMSAKTSLKLSDHALLDKANTNSILSDTLDAASTYSMRNVIDLLDEDEEADDDLDTTKGDLKRSLTVHGNKRLALQNSSNISSSSYDKPIVMGASIPVQRRVRELKIKPNLYAAQNKLTRDIMSVCVSGAPRIRFFKGSRKFCYVQGDKVIIQELRLVPTDSNGDLPEEIKERFEYYLENNSLITSLCMNPILAPYIETYDFISNASSYGLLHALYGLLCLKTPYAKQEERLNRVINWLASVNRKLPPPTNIYQLIVYHMSCDSYDTASELAIENNHPRLALLIATLNLNKDNLFEQLSSWRLSTADQYIDPELLKIYVILSGLTEWKLSNDVTIYSLRGLKWTQQLCLLALHVTSFVTEPDKYGFHMLPLYIKRLETNTNDVDYHILARHSPANILSAADSLIEEWFLLESLKSFHVINSESECANSDIIHCNLASQLGPIDLRWACFVALHIINNEVRNQVLIQCLEQNHNQFNEEKHDFNKANPTSTVETWLLEKLKIPIEFILSTK